MIETNSIRHAIQGWLNDQIQKKTEAPNKKLEKAQDISQQLKLKEEIAAIHARYDLATWLEAEATKFVQQLHFGTHTSKGIHPDSKGDNVYFDAQSELPTEFIGSQSVPKNQYFLDANGNAAALPLAGFFAIEIEDGICLRDLILQDSPALQGVFSANAAQSDAYQRLFKDALLGATDTPATHERNKQILWPNSANAIADDDYTCLIPLHPAALNFYLFKRIQDIKFSEKSKEARETYNKYRNNKTPPEIDTPIVYQTLAPMVYTKLGGTKPQNISQLNSQQGGRQYLLNSLPPVLNLDADKILYPHDASLFNRRLLFRCQIAKDMLAAVVKAPTSTVKIRDLRKSALSEFAAQALIAADALQENSAGWSDDYALNAAEKYWLDSTHPHYENPANIPNDWQDVVAKHFAQWVQNYLRSTFKDKEKEFNDPEYREWEKTFAEALRIGAVA